MRSALVRRIWADPYRLPQYLVSRLSGWAGHRLGIKFPRHAKVIAAKEMLPQDFYDSLFKFAFVRNPWDLQVSSFYHVRRERPHLLTRVKNFPDFLRYKFDPQRPYHYILDASVEPQWLSLIDLGGRLQMDFIGRFEHLGDDFRTVCQEIGLKNMPALPHKRQSQTRGDYRNYYDDWSTQFIAERFKLDIENLGYSFDG